jgi:hypothetical protein
MSKIVRTKRAKGDLVELSGEQDTSKSQEVTKSSSPSNSRDALHGDIHLGIKNPESETSKDEPCIKGAGVGTGSPEINGETGKVEFPEEAQVQGLKTNLVDIGTRTKKNLSVAFKNEIEEVFFVEDWGKYHREQRSMKNSCACCTIF